MRPFNDNDYSPRQPQKKLLGVVGRLRRRRRPEKGSNSTVQRAPEVKTNDLVDLPVGQRLNNKTKKHRLKF